MEELVIRFSLDGQKGEVVQCENSYYRFLLYRRRGNPSSNPCKKLNVLFCTPYKAHYKEGQLCITSRGGAFLCKKEPHNVYDIGVPVRNGWQSKFIDNFGDFCEVVEKEVVFNVLLSIMKPQKDAMDLQTKTIQALEEKVDELEHALNYYKLFEAKTDNLYKQS